MAKAIKTVIKVTLHAGSATPAPPLGPILGQHGVNIMDFVKQYNDRTADQRGEVVPAVITIFEDRSFTFELKLAPVTDMIKKKLRIDKGSGDVPRKIVGTLSQADLEAIAQDKMPDLNANDIEAAKKIVAGSARSMGVKVEENNK
jgi:large subunit ribosomal protein L11